MTHEPRINVPSAQSAVMMKSLITTFSLLEFADFAGTFVMSAVVAFHAAVNFRLVFGLEETPAVCAFLNHDTSPNQKAGVFGFDRRVTVEAINFFANDLLTDMAEFELKLLDFVVVIRIVHVVSLWLNFVLQNYDIAAIL